MPKQTSVPTAIIHTAALIMAQKVTVIVSVIRSDISIIVICWLDYTTGNGNKGKMLKPKLVQKVHIKIIKIQFIMHILNYMKFTGVQKKNLIFFHFYFPISHRTLWKNVFYTGLKNVRAMFKVTTYPSFSKFNVN